MKKTGRGADGQRTGDRRSCRMADLYLPLGREKAGIGKISRNWKDKQVTGRQDGSKEFLGAYPGTNKG